MKKMQKWTFIIAAIAILSIISLFVLILRWRGLLLTISMTDFPSRLLPLVFAAAVIERAVEILVSPWRDPEANRLSDRVNDLKSHANDPTTAEELKVARDALTDYRGGTQRYAFAISISLSVLASIAGVRCFWPFVDTRSFGDPQLTPAAQQVVFSSVDMLLTAVLLAGGAAGIHSVVSAVTSFFDASAAKMQAPA